MCGVVSAALQLEESLRCSRSRHLILKASLTNESFITLIVESVGVCLCVSELQKQCHFDGFFHFFSTLYVSVGKFAGSPNKGQCVRPHEAWSGLWRGARHLWDGGPHQQVSALTPLLFVAFKSKDPKVFVRRHTPFLYLKWAATGVGEMHNSPSVSLFTASVSEIRCLIHTWSNGLTIKELQGFVWLWFIELFFSVQEHAGTRTHILSTNGSRTVAPCAVTSLNCNKQLSDYVSFFFLSRRSNQPQNLQFRHFVLAPFGKNDYISMHARLYVEALPQWSFVWDFLQKLQT